MALDDPRKDFKVKPFSVKFSIVLAVKKRTNQVAVISFLRAIFFAD